MSHCLVPGTQVMSLKSVHGMFWTAPPTPSHPVLNGQPLPLVFYHLSLKLLTAWLYFLN